MTESLSFVPQDGTPDLAGGGSLQAPNLDTQFSEVVAGEFPGTASESTQAIPFGVDLGEKFGKVNVDSLDGPLRTPNAATSACEKVSVKEGTGETSNDIVVDGE